MSRPTRLGDLPRAEWQHWEAVLERFEQAWGGADQVDLAGFLPPPGNPVRPLILQELIKSELEIRCRRGQAPLLEEYLRRFPELDRDPLLWPALLFEEYRARRLYGDQPSLSAYRRRFPAGQVAQLERLIDEHDLPPPSAHGTTPPGPQPTPSAAPAAAPPPAVVGHFGMVRSEAVLPVGGGYKLLRRLGSGTFGEVWRAEAPGGVPVAVKIILRPLDHADAQRELEALEDVKLLDHPYLVKLQAFWPLEDRLVIAMELCDGSLGQRLKQCQRDGLTGVPVAELLRYFGEASEALDYLREERVLHRDIKPDNILLKQRHAKLADFGLARMLKEQQAFAETLCGTPSYMAPEVWEGHACEQSDQYSLAATYVELRLGRMLFPGNNYAQIMAAHLGQQPDLAPLAEAEQAVLRRALAKDPDARYPTCLDFWRGLQQALAPPPPVPTVIVPRPPERPQSAAVPSPQTDAPRPAPVPQPPPLEEAEDRTPTAAIPPPVSEEPVEEEAPPAAEPGPEEPPSPPWPSPRPVPAWKAEASADRGRPWKWVAACLLLVLLTGGILYAVHRAGRHADEHQQLPPWVKEEGATLQQVDGQRYYSRIAFVLADEDHTHVVFRLIVPEQDPRLFATRSWGFAASPRAGEGLLPAVAVLATGNPDLRPFYIMETKVSNRMFRAYPGATKSNAWEQGGFWNGRNTNSDGDYLDCPVYRVPVDEAHEFAHWLGGELPSALQWDWAAGRYVVPPAEGPFRGSAAALAATGPRPVGRVSADVCVFSGCRDMASNGYEWTCSIWGKPGADNLPDESKDVPFDQPTADVAVSLRGAPYSEGEPLTFAGLDVGVQPAKRLGDEQLPLISFRVVLPVPPGAPVPLDAE